MNRVPLLLIAFAVVGCSPTDERPAISEPADPVVVAGETNGSPETPPTGLPPAPPEPSAPSDSGWTTGIVDVPANYDGQPTLTAARLGRHPDWDRLTLEWDSERLPGYHIEYIDRPVRQCGSGNGVELKGDNALSIRTESARAHDDRGHATVEQRTLDQGLPVIQEVKLICDFEGQVEWVLGIGPPNVFRVLTLTNPTRLVVDVRH